MCNGHHKGNAQRRGKEGRAHQEAQRKHERASQEAHRREAGHLRANPREAGRKACRQAGRKARREADGRQEDGPGHG